MARSILLVALIVIIGAAALAGMAMSAYSMGYSAGRSNLTEPQYQRVLLHYQGRRADQDELQSRLSAGWAVESAIGSLDTDAFFVLRKAAP